MYACLEKQKYSLDQFRAMTRVKRRRGGDSSETPPDVEVEILARLPPECSDEFQVRVKELECSYSFPIFYQPLSHDGVVPTAATSSVHEFAGRTGAVTAIIITIVVV
ncbi:unnamed protein product [Microthlaspi erraticum]|uniref:Uncharacterized protein n=1 Tax=Microthlaspi erraticum TaxID=1685480 RepID=A0A6D2JGQ5_9BRAS|nr:unnamed protein product [Microthlaspi erraticum]